MAAEQTIRLKRMDVHVTAIHGDAHQYNEVTAKADIILTDPPFEMPGKELVSIIDSYQQDHLILLCSMRQLLEFSKHSAFQLNFDLVLDLVAPKQSKSVKQPNYIHVHAVYMTRNNAKSLFDRKRAERSDTATHGYYPTILRAPRERNEHHGHAKNIEAIKNILSFFDVKTVLDIFAGSGTTALACAELDLESILVEKNIAYFHEIKNTFNFMGFHNVLGKCE